MQGPSPEGWDVNQRNYCVLVLGYSSRNVIVNLFIVVQMKVNPPWIARCVREIKREGVRLFLLLEGKS